MIKKLALSVLCLLSFRVAHGQDMIEKICNSVCSCIDTIENMDSLQAKLDRCVPKALDIYFTTESDDNDDYFSDSDTIKNTIDKVMNNLTSYCPKVKNFILANKQGEFYKMSDSDEANKYYSTASKAFEAKDYKTAEKNYLKAIKASPGWVLPYDDLGLTYRQIGKNKKAIKYYNKSLAIYPEGSYALQNQAVAYTYLNDYDKALDNYSVMINLYPDNPEGYFGKGRIFFLENDYEKALEYLFHCHKIYVAMKSDYAKDTESIVAAIYKKMKEQNKLDVFNSIAEKHGIKINQE